MGEATRLLGVDVLTPPKDLRSYPPPPTPSGESVDVSLTHCSRVARVRGCRSMPEFLSACPVCAPSPGADPSTRLEAPTS
eukprot:1373494-Pleurochrysis_carterae.AAC.1